MMANSRPPAARAAASAVLTDAPAASNTARFWVIVAITVLLDFVTKALAVEHLVPRHMPHEIIGNVVRFTLAYNPGAAFGMHLGPASRWIFAGLSVVIVGGAIGNLLDRIRLREGVVDFIDIGIGTTRFWTFNVADTAVTIGAVCLVLALWREDQALQEAAKAAGAPGAGGQGGGTS